MKQIRFIFAIFPSSILILDLKTGRRIEHFETQTTQLAEQRSHDGGKGSRTI